jgi:hypothetical protein
VGSYSLLETRISIGVKHRQANAKNRQINTTRDLATKENICLIGSPKKLFVMAVSEGDHKEIYQCQSICDLYPQNYLSGKKNRDVSPIREHPSGLILLCVSILSPSRNKIDYSNSCSRQKMSNFYFHESLNESGKLIKIFLRVLKKSTR